jgi:hypothetical protein
MQMTTHHRPNRKTCRECEHRRAHYRYRGRVRWRRDHDTCFKCQVSSRAGEQPPVQGDGDPRDRQRRNRVGGSVTASPAAGAGVRRQRSWRSSAIAVVLLVSWRCTGDRAVPLRDLKRGLYPRDSVFTLFGELANARGLSIPLSGRRLSTFSQNSDTISIIVSDDVPPGKVRLRVRVHESEILNLYLGRIVVAVDASAARTTPSRKK